MTEQELFGALVRITGFWIALYGLWLLTAGFAMLYGGLKPKDEDKDTATVGQFFFWGALAVFFGCLILGTAGELVRAIYR